jgi:hypothetical protein
LLEISSAGTLVKRKLHNDDTLVERSVLQVEAIVGLLEICFRTTHFHVNDEFFQQKDGMAIRSYLPSSEPFRI